ncbi:MAG: glycine cleavage system protein T [Rhodospirillaceae bacterium]|nr:MAG: glycine cleavage system protein T [Rhodospirillaceae bacterium]
MPPSVTLLEARGILQIAGADTRSFLQGLMTTDINKASETRALYGALLTPQGKYLHDFFVAQMGDCVYLEAEKARLADLKKRLLLYKLRADILIADVTGEFRVYALFGEGALAALNLDATAGAARTFKGGCLYVDPRLAAAGTRAILPIGTTPDFEGFVAANFDKYDRFRIGLGLADGSRDLVPEKSLLLDYGFDELNGIDWKKGCYVGQEVTARMKHRGLSRKRLLPVTLAGKPPAPGTLVQLADRDVGTLTSVCGDIGLALLQLDAVEKAAQEGTALQAGAAQLTPTPPSWLRL